MISTRSSIRAFWKPDGKKVDVGNQDKLKRWMQAHGFSTGAGAITLLVHSAVHESARDHAVRMLKARSGR
jgi:hypothetical protein